MAGGSPVAFLLWSILSVLFYCFLVFHLWNYDRFRCLRWSEARRRPGAFKRVMSYTYIATLTLLVVFTVAFTLLKFKEGYIFITPSEMTSMPLELYTPARKKWVLPLLFAFSVAWACELVTHLEELTFWLFLQNQGPRTRVWFDSWEFRLWLSGSVVAILGMPMTALIARKQLDLCLAWIFLIGSSASTLETLSFLVVLVHFPAFLRKVKDDGAAANIMVRLVYSYQLNRARIVFRFLFSVPLLVLAIDAVQGSHPVNLSPFWSDFLLMLAGIASFVSSAITLLVFFPRSLISELGYAITFIPTDHSGIISHGKPPSSPAPSDEFEHRHQHLRLHCHPHSPVRFPGPDCDPDRPSDLECDADVGSDADATASTVKHASRYIQPPSPKSTRSLGSSLWTGVKYEPRPVGAGHLHLGQAAMLGHAHSHEGHVRPRKSPAGEPSHSGGAGDAVPSQLHPHTHPLVPCPYVFDSGAKVQPAVRSSSEGRAGLHPYIRDFKSPIDICDEEQPYDSA